MMAKVPRCDGIAAVMMGDGDDGAASPMVVKRNDVFGSGCGEMMAYHHSALMMEPLRVGCDGVAAVMVMGDGAAMESLRLWWWSQMKPEHKRMDGDGAKEPHRWVMV